MIRAIFKWIFILFNILGCALIGLKLFMDQYRTGGSSDGISMSSGDGFAILFGFWAIGAVILGLPLLFMKPKEK